MTDISDTLAPNSDQLDAVDLRGNPPRIFTITKVDVKKNADQPVSVHLAEFPRVWRPGKSMRRVLAYCWGNDSAGWIDHRVELYCDDGVMFAGEAIGGTRISRLSHIDKPKSVPLIIGQGKTGVWKVKPLPEEAPAAPEPTPDELAEQVAQGIKDSTTEAEVREWGNRAHNRGLLDLEVEGQALRDRVTEALAALSANTPEEQA